jgi:hypothetical protein
MPAVTSSAARARALGLNVAVAVLPVSRLGARSSNLASSATAASSSSDVADVAAARVDEQCPGLSKLGFCVERVEINFHRAFALREHPAVPHARPAALLAATAGVKL